MDLLFYLEDELSKGAIDLLLSISLLPVLQSFHKIV